MNLPILIRKRSVTSLSFATILFVSMFVSIAAVPILSQVANAGLPPLPANFTGTPTDFFNGKPTNTGGKVEKFANIDPILRDWMTTGVASNRLRQSDGKVFCLVGTGPEIDLHQLSTMMRIKNVFPYGAMGYLVQGYVTHTKQIIAIDEMAHTGAIMGDALLSSYDESQNGPTTHGYIVQDVIENDMVQATWPTIDGTGTTVGIVDQGVDFSHTDLAGTLHRNSSGYVTSYDPGGTCLAIVSHTLAPVAGYLPVEGLDWTFWDTEWGSTWSWFSLINYYSNPIRNISDLYVGGYGGIVSQSGFYKVGIISQYAGTLGTPHLGLFLLVDETTPFVYDTLYIDWETSWGMTKDANGYTTGPEPDYDFTDNIGDPHRWGDGSEVMAVDFDGDGVNDFGFGALANCLDLFDVISGDVVEGIDTMGRGFAFHYDYGGHGTSCAGAVAGQGIVEYDLYENGTLYTVPGVAPGAKIMGLKLFTFGDSIHCWFWGSGYRPFEYTWYGPFTGDPVHKYGMWNQWVHCGYLGWDYSNQAHILSNSWGYVGHEFTGSYGFIWGVDWASLTVDFLMTGGCGEDYYNVTGSWWDPISGSNPLWPDGYIAAAPLFVISSGNAGPGYGTSGSPNGVNSLLVGASTTSHYAQPTYNNDSSLGPQPYDQLADFSSAGPTPQSLPKPDCVAPGAWQWDVAMLASGHGNGSLAFRAFGGTSAAGPVAAGVASLVFQALADPLGAIPDGEPEGLVKTIVKSSCDDIGQAPLRQGAGRVNAYEAVKLAFLNSSSSIWFASNHTFADFSGGGSADGRAGWWRAVYMQMDYVGNPYYGGYTPYSFAAFDYSGDYFSWMDSGFATHQVFPGDSEYHDVLATAGDGSDIDSLDALMYQEFNSSTHTFTSTSTYTTYPLFGTYSGIDNFDAIFMDQFISRADYAIIYVQYDKADFDELYGLAGQANYVFLHDWNDTNGNNVIDLQSADSVGEVRRVAFDYSASNCHQIHVGNPGAQWLGDQNATLYYHDVGVELFLWRSLDVTVTIRLFEKVDWDWFTFTQYGGSGPLWNVSYTVPVSADPGIYAGFVIATLGAEEQLFPITCRVDGQVAPGSTLTWGGANGMPYDSGAITGAIDYDGRYMSGEWRYYYVDVAALDGNYTTWVMTNVSWVDPDTCVDVMLYMTGYGSRGYFDQGWLDSDYDNIDGGYWQGTPSGLNPPQNVLFLDWSWDLGVSATDRGYLMIVLHVSEFGGNYLPEDLTITVAPVSNHTLNGYYGAVPDLPGPTGDVVINSAGKHTNEPIVDDGIYEGPHAMLTGTFDPYALPGFPSISIKQTDLQYRVASDVTYTGWFVEGNCTPDSNYYSPPWDAMFEWEGIAAGMILSVQYQWWGVPDLTPGTGPDLDCFLYTPGGVELMGIYGDWHSYDEWEEITCIAPETGTYIVGVDYFDDDSSSPYGWGPWDSVYFEAICSASAVVSNIEDGLTVTADTADIGLNTAVDIALKGITGTSLDQGPLLEVVWTNVTLTNFFEPVITSLDPNGGEDLGPEPFTISWTATDENLDEALGFSVEVSNDSGTTWKVITYGTTLNSIVWDPDSSYYGLVGTDQMLVRVNCTDGRYTVSRTSAAVFTVENTPPFVRPAYELFVVIGVAVIVIVILLVTCLLKRRQTAAK